MTDLALLPHQARIIANTTKPYLLCVGGLGSAKTHLGSAWVVLKALRLHGTVGAIICPNFPELREYAIPGVKTILEEEPPLGLGLQEGKDGDWWLNKFEMCFYFKNGSRIVMKSADNPTGIKGSNWAYAWVDEPGLISDDALNRVPARLRGPDIGCLRQTLYTGTPEGMSGRFFEYAEDSPRYPEHHPKAGQEMVFRVRASTLDNVFLQPSPQEYVDVHLIGFTDAEKEAYIHGRFVPPRGRVYSQFDRDRHVRPCRNRFAGELYMLCDFNRAPMWWCFARRIGDSLHVWHDLIAEQTDTIEHSQIAAKTWAKMMTEDRGHYVSPREASREVTVFCDASGSARRTSSSATDVQQLREVGFAVRHNSRNPFVNDRVHSVQKMLEQDRLHFDPQCARTIKCFAEQGFARDGSPDKTKDLDHGPDACGYGVYFNWPAIRPRANSIRAQQYA